MITINEQSSIRISLEKTIYVDPFHLDESFHDADLIFITHSHYDHFSIEDILKCKKEDTIIITVGDTYAKLTPYFERERIILVKPEETFSVLGVSVQTTLAYNIDKKYHLPEYQWVGYILTLEGQRYYFMGDTDVLDFMKDISCDYLFIPIGGTYTMDIESAVSLTNQIHPSVVIPIHYGTIIGDRDLGTRFSKMISPEISCQILLNFQNSSD